jgi:3-dehydroquinate synthase
MFLDLERGAARPWGRNGSASARLVARCCRIKAGFVEADERESTGRRSALNFGHTFGHALERDGRSGLMHGEAVGLGMMAACALAEELGVAREPQRKRLKELLSRLGLPVRLPKGISLSSVRRAWRSDKKAIGGVPRFVLTPRIGCVSVGHVASEEQIEASFQTVFQ